MVVGTTQKMRWLDSSAISNSIELLVGSQVYETLLRNNPQTGLPEPWLAQNYTLSADGQTYTFKLRQGIKFQDGTALNSAAVKSSLIRAFVDPDTISIFLANILNGVNSAYSAGLGANASKAIDTPDDNTVVFHLAGPTSIAPYLFAMANTAISSPTHNDRTQDQYVGTGPFSFVSWTRDDNVKLAPNPNYWNKDNQNPNIKSLTFKFFASATAMQSSLLTSGIDVALWDLTPTQAKDLSTNSNVKFIQGEQGRYVAMDLNNGTAPFNNLLVRQAVAYAIDPNQIISTVYGPVASLSPTFFPPGYPYISNAFGAKYHVNVTMAKQLLTQAGYPNGFAAKLEYSPTQYGEAETPLVTLVQQQLSAVGITLTLQPVEITQFIRDARAGTPQMLSFHWIYDYFGPYQYVYNIMYGGPKGAWAKYMGYSDSVSTQLLDQIRSTTDQTKLPGLYAQLQQRATTTIPLVPIGFLQDHFYTQPYVSGLQVAFLGSSAANGAFAKVAFSR